MLELIFIGTLHCGFTLNDELEDLFVKYKPDTLFVEIVQEDIDLTNLSSYPPEMIFSLEYAKKNAVKLVGFDSKIYMISKASDEKNNQKVIQEQGEIIKKYSWKSFNKEKYNQLLHTPSWENLIDQNKWNKRENKMKDNIKKNLPKTGTVMIITGTSHLKFFEKMFPKALFPLRTEN